MSHGCCCTSSSPSVLCPYHLMLDHFTMLQERFPARFDEFGWALPGFPLFPDSVGNACSKAGVTHTIRAAASKLGQALVDPGGLYLHSGHAMRVTGAQALARAGLPELTISLLARWGSSAVRTYIRKAPLSASHRLAAMALAGWQANDASSPRRTISASCARTDANGGKPQPRTSAKSGPSVQTIALG